MFKKIINSLYNGYNGVGIRNRQHLYRIEEVFNAKQLIIVREENIPILDTHFRPISEIPNSKQLSDIYIYSIQLRKH